MRWLIGVAAGLIVLVLVVVFGPYQAKKVAGFSEFAIEDDE